MPTFLSSGYDQLVVWGAYLILGAVFFWSGATKLRHSRRFIYVVIDYKLLPEWLIIPFARGLPYLEIGVGLCLLSGVAAARAAVITLVLLSSFVLAVSINLWRGRRTLPCGCFGSNQTIGKPILFRNLVLLLLSLLVLREGQHPLSDSPLLAFVTLPTLLPLSLIAVGGGLLLRVSSLLVPLLRY